MVDVHGYVISCASLIGESIPKYTYRRGLLHCSFNNFGQCEGLYEWNGRVRFPRFLYNLNNIQLLIVVLGIGNNNIACNMESKNIILKSSFIAVVCIICSCGSSKKTTVSNNNPIVMEVQQEVDECVKLANAKPETRAWGEAYNHRLSFANTYAEGQARAMMQRKISTAINSASSEEQVGYEKGAYSGNGGATVQDDGSKSNLFADQIAKGVVNNTAVIKTSQYLRADGQYHMFVCIEYRDGISKMAEDITKKVQQQVSDEDRMKMNFEFNKFRDRIEQEMKNSKNE
jgi:hypothetical protein